MKNSLPLPRSAVEPLRRLLWSTLLPLVLCISALSPAPARANSELDRTYSLESVAALRSSDNVDGLFADYVSSAYKDYFARQSRFTYQELGRSDAIIEHSKVPYNEVIADTQILGQLARSIHAESLIRTRIVKEGPDYKFTVEWLHSPRMELMASDTFTLQEKMTSKDIDPGTLVHQVSLSEIRDELQKSLDRVIRKVPFAGTVTGRDGDQITINLGAITGIRRGDELVIGTLEEVKKHPLLKAIVDWRFAETGRAVVESVDERIAFARIQAEGDGRQIARYQKILNVVPPKPAPTAQLSPQSPQAEGQGEELPPEDDKPRLGWISAGPLVGGFSRQYANVSGTGQSGGGLELGMRADAQLWLTRAFFIEAGFGYSFWSYSQQALTASGATGASSSGVSASLSSFRADLGYTYLLKGDFFGPKGWVKAGFRNSSYTFPTATAASGADTGPISFTDVFLGLGADVPVRGRLGALLNFEFGLFPTASETGFITGPVSSALDLDFSLGAYYRYTPRLSFRCMLDILANSVDYGSGTTLSQKAISIVPTVVYSF